MIIRDFKITKKMEEALLKQQNLNYIIETYVFKNARKVFIHISAVKLIEMYAIKQNVEPLNNLENVDSYPRIFKEVLKLKLIRHVGKKSPWFPNEGIVLTKRGKEWRDQNYTREDFD